MRIKREKQTARLTAVPVSAFAALSLQTPLTLFGCMPVHISSPLTLAPDTVMRAVFGFGIQEFLRHQNPGFHALLRKLLYVARKEHKLSPGLRMLLQAELAFASAAIPSADLERSINDPTYFAWPRSDWETLLTTRQSGSTDNSDDIISQTFCWLAACDTQGFFLMDLVKDGEKLAAEKLAKTLLGPSQVAWQTLNPKLSSHMLVPIDICIMSMARLEWEAIKREGPTTSSCSTLVSLLRPGQRPIGHWMKEVCSQSRLRNLSQLSAALLRRGAQYRNGPVSHERLKKWSRSKEVLIPPAALKSILAALNPEVKRQAIEYRFYVARLFSFLCDLTRSSTLDETPSWEAVQAQIERRYTEAYRRQVKTDLLGEEQELS